MLCMRKPADTDDAPSKGGASLTFGIPDKNLNTARAGPSNVGLVLFNTSRNGYYFLFHQGP